jgi:hypothetical protein
MDSREILLAICFSSILALEVIGVWIAYRHSTR